MEEKRVEEMESDGLIIGEPMDLRKIFGISPKITLPPAIDFVIVYYGLRGMEGTPALLSHYQGWLMQYDEDTAPLEHVRAWEILVGGRMTRNRTTAAAILRWGLTRCTP